MSVSTEWRRTKKKEEKNQNGTHLLWVNERIRQTTTDDHPSIVDLAKVDMSQPQY